MADVTRVRQGEYLRGVFGVTMTHPEGLRARDVLNELANRLTLTPFEQTEYETGGRRFEKLVRFATIPAVKAGWLVKDRGTWIITEEGRTAYEKISDPAEFLRESVRHYKKWRLASEAKPSEELDELTDPVDPEGKEAVATLEESEERAWVEIEAYLAAMNPYDFQNLVAGLLRGMGYHVSWVAPPGPDRGIDVIAHADPLGVTGPRVKVQVKRRADRVPVGEIRSFMAMLSEGDVGLFVASGGFTKDAEDEARYQERRRVTLIDLKRLFDLWVEHYSRIPEVSRRLLSLRPVHFLAPEEG